MKKSTIQSFVKLIMSNYYDAYDAYMENGRTEAESKRKAFIEIRQYVRAIEKETGFNWKILKEMNK